MKHATKPKLGKEHEGDSKKDDIQTRVLNIEKAGMLSTKVCK